MNDGWLDRRDVLGAWTLWSSAFRVGDFLTFAEFFKSSALQARRVEEKIFGATSVDESKSLVGQFLDSTFGHECVSQKDFVDGCLPAYVC